MRRAKNGASAFGPSPPCSNGWTTSCFSSAVRGSSLPSSRPASLSSRALSTCSSVKSLSSAPTSGMVRNAGSVTTVDAESTSQRSSTAARAVGGNGTSSELSTCAK